MYTHVYIYTYIYIYIYIYIDIYIYIYIHRERERESDDVMAPRPLDLPEVLAVARLALCVFSLLCTFFNL